MNISPIFFGKIYRTESSNPRVSQDIVVLLEKPTNKDAFTKLKEHFDDLDEHDTRAFSCVYK